MCLSVLTSESLQLESSLYFVVRVHLQNTWLSFAYQGHWVKVKVTGISNGRYERNNIHTSADDTPSIKSLAIPPWVGAMSTSQRAVMPYGWGVKAGMVCEWVAGKTV